MAGLNFALVPLEALWIVESFLMPEELAAKFRTLDGVRNFSNNCAGRVDGRN